MKKLFIKSNLIIVTVLLLVTACEQDIIMFDSSMNLVGFTTTEITIPEPQATASPVTLYFGATPGTLPATISLSVDNTEFGESGAIEGTDFTVSSKSVSVGANEEVSVNITPVDNDVFTGNKRFNLVITATTDNSKISAQKNVLVTISDDEHPLKNWIGTYTVTAKSYGKPGAWDEEWTISTSAVEGNLDQISITGLGYGSTEPLIATIDKDALTITIESGQELGNAYGSDNGAVKLYFGTSAIIGQVLAQEEITSEMLAEALQTNITGTIKEDGTIDLDKMAMVLTDYDWCWDVFNTSWNKN